MRKNKTTIGLLILLVLIFAVCSYFLVNSIRNKEPSRAKLVYVSEVIQYGKCRGLYTTPGGN
jgi:hypothetical protein